MKRNLRRWLDEHFEVYLIEKFHFPLYCPIELRIEFLGWKYIPVSAQCNWRQCATLFECWFFLLLYRLKFKKDKYRIVKLREEYPGYYSFYSQQYKSNQL